MVKTSKRILASILFLALIGGLFTYIPSLFTFAEEVEEYTAFYTSFDNGNVAGETYRGNPLVGMYDSSRSENVRATNSNDWAMSMVESVDGNQAVSSARALEKLLDGTASTSYATNTEFPVIIEYKMYDLAEILNYSITSTANYNDNAPADWTFEGSNDGEEWTVLDTQTEQVFAKRSQTKKYHVTQKSVYSNYRIVITKKAGGATSGTVQFSDLILRNAESSNETITGGALGVEKVVGGPKLDYNGHENLPWKGSNSLKVTANHIGNGRGYSNAYLFTDLNIPVTEYTYLNYVILPDFINKNAEPSENYDYEYTSQYVALDIQFTDGTYMSDLGAIDQNGHGMSARAQGETQALFTRNWNNIETNVGAVANGKTIDKIVVVFDKPSTETNAELLAYFDDVKIYDRAPKYYDNLIEYTNTRRGSNDGGTDTNRGLTYPATCVPNAFNLWTPSTTNGDRKIYDYHPSSKITHFMITHQASFHLLDYGDFMFMPNTSIDNPSTTFASGTRVESSFDHDNEIAHANYYSVILDEGSPASGVKTEMAPTDHAGLVRFTFPETSANVNVILDCVCSYGIGNMKSDMDLVFSDNGKTFTAIIDYGSTQYNSGYPLMYLYGEFDIAPESYGSNTGSRTISHVQFADGTTEVNMRLATSYISLDQAKKNLELEISEDDTVETVTARTERLWEEILGVIEVEGASEEEMISLYSNLYRLYVFPTNFSENTGTAEVPVISHLDIYNSTHDNPVVKKGAMYTTNGFWDTYRTCWAAYALLTPEKDSEFLDGLLAHYDDKGWVGRWLNPGGVDSMVSTASDIVFADAAVKGIDFDYEKAYQSMLRNASTPRSGNFGRINNNSTPFLGYNPGNIAWSLEAATTDYAISQMAGLLGYDSEYKYYRNLARTYVNIFNYDTDFFMVRRTTGWKYSNEEFNPYDWLQGYCETNAWGTAFAAAQDPQGLAYLYGGKEGLAAKLDQLFAETNKWVTEDGYNVHEMYESREVRMGQYQHSNQPAHHEIYMYAYADQPYKVQEKTREVLDRLYIGSSFAQGYIGDEDNGEMSAWYILSALGFYSSNMASGEYVITSPLYDKYTLHLPSGDLTVTAKNNSSENIYIQSMEIDGKRYNKSFITHEDLLKAKEIVFVMGDTPSDWATETDSTPSSITQLREIPVTATDYSKSGVTNYLGITSTSGLFDDNSTSYASVMTNGTIDFSFAEAKKVEMITVTSGNKSLDRIGIKLCGSVDGTEGSYVELINQQNCKYQWASFIRPYEVANPDEYSYYRLELSGNETFSIGEVELLGEFNKYEETVEGDIDGDGEVTIIDALKVLRVSLGFASMRDIDIIADMDGDEKLTVSDALAILKKACLII